MADADVHYVAVALPLGPDETEYRLVTTEGVRTVDTPLGTFVDVSPEAITRLTAEAMHDIAHFLRTSHLEQLRRASSTTRRRPTTIASSPSTC